MNSAARRITLLGSIALAIVSLSGLVSAAPPVIEEYTPLDLDFHIPPGTYVPFGVWARDTDGDLAGVEWYMAGDYPVEVAPLSGSWDSDGFYYTFNSLGTFTVAAVVYDSTGAYSAEVRWWAHVELVGPVVYDGHNIQDSPAFGGSGNADNIVNPGETIVLPVKLRNEGLSTATGVTATLTESDAYVTVTDNQASYGDISAGAGKWGLDKFKFEVSGTAPDGHIVTFTVHARDGSHTWTSTFTINIVKPEVVVHFPDLNLEAVVREALGKPTGDITDADMATLTSLAGRTRSIRDLNGLEHATNLQYLLFAYNQIVDISPLAGLTKLYYLELPENLIVDISPVAGLGNLRYLYLHLNQIVDVSPLASLANLPHLTLYSNQIVDISPLAGLTNLRGIFIGYNRIVDISPFAGLTKMEDLRINGNRIVDISPLAGLTNLQSLFLRDNQITDISSLVTNSQAGGLSAGDYVDLRVNYLDISQGSKALADIQTLINSGATVIYEPQNELPDVEDIVSATINGLAVDMTNPEITVVPGTSLSGTIAARSSGYHSPAGIYPFIIYNSWERNRYDVLDEGIPYGGQSYTYGFPNSGSTTAPAGNPTWVVPGTPGTYYVCIEAQAMYNSAEVASNDDPAAFGDGDDNWDVGGNWDASGWEDMVSQKMAIRVRVVTLAPSGDNLLVNAGFEIAPLAGWGHSDPGIYSSDSPNARTGSYCAKGVETASGRLGRLYQDFTGKLTVGKKYKIGGWVKTEGVSGAVVIALDYVNSAGWCPADGYLTEIAHVSGTTGWTYYESPEFTLPAMPADCSMLWFLFDFNAGTGMAWFDDVSLVEVAPANQPPAATVTSPATGSVVEAADQLVFSLSDPDDSSLETRIHVGSLLYPRSGAWMPVDISHGGEFRITFGELLGSDFEYRSGTPTEIHIEVRDEQFTTNSDICSVYYGIPSLRVRFDLNVLLTDYSLWGRLDFIRDVFQGASDALFDATDGQICLGNVYLYPNDLADDRAFGGFAYWYSFYDIHIFAGEDTSRVDSLTYLGPERVLPVPFNPTYVKLYLGRDPADTLGSRLLHELGHLKWGLEDHYIECVMHGSAIYEEFCPSCWQIIAAKHTSEGVVAPSGEPNPGPLHGPSIDVSVRVSPLFFFAFSPVDLEIVDPLGRHVDPSQSSIPGTIYLESDYDGDGEAEDFVVVPEPTSGEYEVQAIPETGANPSDTYSLFVARGDDLLGLVQDGAVSEIPESFTVTVTPESLFVGPAPPLPPEVPLLSSAAIPVALLAIGVGMSRRAARHRTLSQS